MKHIFNLALQNLCNQMIANPCKWPHWEVPHIPTLLPASELPEILLKEMLPYYITQAMT